MKGTRPLDNSEIRLVSACFDGNPFEARNRGLFMLGVSTGGRISELLSLTVGDVYQNQKPVTDLLFDRSIVKGGEISRAVPVNSDGRRATSEIIAWHEEKYNTIAPSRPLFPSRNKNGSVAMNRQTAHEMLKKAFQAAGLNGKLATHSLRKSFAQRVYEESGDIYLVQELLGHRNVSTTQKYIGVNYATARETVEAIALEAKASSSAEAHPHDDSDRATSDEPYRTDLLSRSLSCSHLGGELKATADETLFLELALRGYDLSKLRENNTTAEIVKVG